MTSLKLDIKGLDEVMRGLRKLDGQMKEALGRIAVGVGLELSNELKIYPPQRDTPYIRTNKLKRGWHVRRKGTNAVVGNPVEYAPFVQSEAQQAKVHHGFWDGYTDKDVVERVEDEDVKRIAMQIIRRLLRRVGLK